MKVKMNFMLDSKIVDDFSKHCSSNGEDVSEKLEQFMKTEMINDSLNEKKQFLDFEKLEFPSYYVDEDDIFMVTKDKIVMLNFYSKNNIRPDNIHYSEETITVFDSDKIKNKSNFLYQISKSQKITENEFFDFVRKKICLPVGIDINYPENDKLKSEELERAVAAEFKVKKLENVISQFKNHYSSIIKMIDETEEISLENLLDEKIVEKEITKSENENKKVKGIPHVSMNISHESKNVFSLKQEGNEFYIKDYELNTLYYAGIDLIQATNAINKLNSEFDESQKINLKSQFDGLYCCFGKHYVEDKCDFVKIIDFNNTKIK